MNRLLQWELSGIIFVFLFGALLHFVFEWSGESGLVGAFASVNESVWEHFKQGFWPMMVFAGIEFIAFRNTVNNFLTAKAAAVYLIPIITALLFYGYTAVTGEEILIVDILIFAIAISIGQLASYRIMTSNEIIGPMRWVSLTMICVLGLVLVFFTFYPPHLPIFQDPSGIYGIP